MKLEIKRPFKLKEFQTLTNGTAFQYAGSTYIKCEPNVAVELIHGMRVTFSPAIPVEPCSEMILVF